MLTLSYGVKKPETNDRGSVFFPALEGNAQIQNDHFHNGSDSAFIVPASITKYTSDITTGNWSSDGGGNYSYQFTVPSGITGATAPYNDVFYYNIICKINTAGSTYGDIVALDIEYVDADEIIVRTNDNSVAIKVFYS